MRVFAIVMALTALLTGCRALSSSVGELLVVDRAAREVIELHQFFQDWFNGEIEQTDGQFARFADVLDPSFHIVTPDASVLDRAAILEAVRGGYASARESGPMHIWIENMQVRQVTKGAVLATYEEWQQRGDREARGRLSTVVFAIDQEAPNWLAWLHVHETWLPPK